MQITIDGVEEKFDFGNQNILCKKIIEEVETLLLKEGKMVTAFSINSQQYTAHEITEKENEMLSPDTVLTFNSISIEKFIKERITGAQKANENFMVLLKEFSNNLKGGGSQQQIARIIEEIESFFVFWKQVQQSFPQIEQVKMNKKPFKEWLENIKSLLKEVVDAMEQNNFSLARDIIAYEVVNAVEEAQALLSQMEANFEEEESVSTSS